MVRADSRVRRVQQSVHVPGEHDVPLAPLLSSTTLQYFLWYMLFLPLLIPKLQISVRRALLFLGVWAGTQALWLSEAYRLEFLGQDVYFGLWVRGLVYVIGNCWVLAGIMQCYL